jgi:hypothetical protein
MSDTGKVLVDASGDPLKGVGGIVLADRLYPYVITGDLSVSRWYRSLTSSTWPPIADVNVWGESWQSGDADANRQVRTDNETQAATQVVHKIVLSNLEYANYPTLEIPFAQIERIRFSFTATMQVASGDDGEVVYFRAHSFIGSDSNPSGSEEVWDRTGWTEFVTSGNLDVGDSDNPANNTETFTLDVTPAQIEDGEIIIWLASFFDVYTPPNPPIAFARQIRFGYSGVSTGRIKYNLAT